MMGKFMSNSLHPLQDHNMFEGLPQSQADVIESLADWHIDTERPGSSVVFVRVKGPNGVEVKPQEVPDALHSVMKLLIQKLRHHDNHDGSPSFTIEVAQLRFRAQLMRPRRYALRVIDRRLPELNSLNLGSQTTDMLMDPEFKTGGLILISGSPGAGKTTTAAATVIARLRQYGGYCLAVESPIERDFEGFHGDGYAEQIDASNTGFEVEVASAMRKFPSEIRSIFFFGEVIEKQAASELTRLIGRGHLVITTIHARDTIRAIEMLVALAEQGGETNARQLIGANLLAVVHQQLVNRKPIATTVRINEAMKNIICNQDAKLFLLTNEIDLAKRQVRNRRATDREPNNVPERNLFSA